jgi:hypothetical protein
MSVSDMDRARIDDYLDGAGSADERAELEARLADDAGLRAELVERGPEAAGLAASRPTTPRWPWLAAAVVAGLAVVVGLGVLNPDRPQLDEVMRSAPAEPAPIELLAPRSGVQIAAGEVELRWTPVEAALGYAVVVMDAAGQEVLRQEASSPTLRVDLGGREGALYWFVEARRPDGPPTASPIQVIFVSP